jgi:hypothetical protein
MQLVIVPNTVTSTLRVIFTKQSLKRYLRASLSSSLCCPVLSVLSFSLLSCLVLSLFSNQIFSIWIFWNLSSNLNLLESFPWGRISSTTNLSACVHHTLDSIVRTWRTQCGKSLPQGVSTVAKHVFAVCCAWCWFSSCLVFVSPCFTLPCLALCCGVVCCGVVCCGVVSCLVLSPLCLALLYLVLCCVVLRCVVVWYGALCCLVVPCGVLCGAVLSCLVLSPLCTTVKLESEQVTGSFKARGATNKIHAIAAKLDGRTYTPVHPYTVVTASTGNHGMATCHAMSTLTEAQRTSMQVSFTTILTAGEFYYYNDVKRAHL